MKTGYRGILTAALLLLAGLFLTACTDTTEVEQEPTLIHVEVSLDVQPASARFLVDGAGAGSVGPGCQLIIAVSPGAHTVTYEWAQGSIARDVEVSPGETLIVRISQGPQITLPDKAYDSDVCTA